MQEEEGAVEAEVDAETDADADAADPSSSSSSSFPQRLTPNAPGTPFTAPLSRDRNPNAPRIKRTHAAMQARRSQFLSHIAEGNSIAEACNELGIARTTYKFWRSEDKIFAAKVDAIRHGNDTIPESELGDFANFRKRFFGFDSYFHHMEIVRALESAEPMTVTMVLCPPEFGKTSLVEDWICYSLAVNPNLRITVVSEGQPHAKKIVGRVQRRMTDHARYSDYISTFGPFYVDGQERKGRPWTSEFMTVWKADHDERDFSLEARGSNSAIAGTRADILIFDDIQSRKNLNATDSLVEKIRQDFLTRPGKEGRTLFVGTRVDVGDVYETLQDQGIVNKLIALPATDVEYDARGNLTATEIPCDKDNCSVPELIHEASLCPQMWSPHDLAFRRRQVGDAVWWRNYQQKPMLAGDATFSESLIADAWDDLRRIGQVSADPNGPRPIIALGLDPALGGGNAVTACALYPDKLEVLDAVSVSGLGTIQGVIAQVDLFAKTYGASLCVVESDTHQKGIARSSEMETLCREVGMHVIEARTSGEKADPVLGVAMMAGGFSRKEIRLPGGDDYARRRMDSLVHELRSWRHDVATKKLRQDQVMSLWFVWKYWMETRHRGDATTFNRGGTPWKPTGWKRQSGYLHHQTRRTA